MLLLHSLNLPWSVRNAIQNKIWMLSVWTKYDYLCTDCDALIEITTLVDIRRDEYASCPCGSNKAINIGVSDGYAPIITDVSKITPRTVVKIDSNPYN